MSAVLPPILFYKGYQGSDCFRVIVRGMPVLVSIALMIECLRGRREIERN